jgi:hypothetical protein
MRQYSNPFLRAAARYLGVGTLAASSLTFAQYSATPPPPNDAPAATSGSGWKRVGDPANQANTAQQDPSQSDPAQGNPAGAPPPPQQPTYQQQQQPNYPQQQPNYPQQRQTYPQQQTNQPQQPVPSRLNVPRGTFLTVRVNQLLSTDKNQAGDAFSATLTQPLVVDGVVIAEPGQTLAGRVEESQKAGHVEGTARLGVQLTELTLVDGQQVPIQSSLISRKGNTSVGRDAGAIAGTTALGAIIGSAADWGRGAAIGAGAGAAAGVIGVLVTRGHPSVIYPEQELTFRIETPITISTDRAPQAFRYVQPNEYDRPHEAEGPGQFGSGAPSLYGAAPYPAGPGYYAPYPYVYGGYPYYGFGYPYYGGLSFSFFSGPRFGYGRGFYRGGYGRGGFRGGGFRGGHR